MQRKMTKSFLKIAEVCISCAKFFESGADRLDRQIFQQLTIFRFVLKAQERHVWDLANAKNVQFLYRLYGNVKFRETG